MVTRPGPRDAARRIAESAREGRGIVVLLVLGPGADTGARRILDEESATGDLGDEELRQAMDTLGREVLAGDVSPGPRGRDAGTHTVRTSAGEVRVYVERYLPAPELVIVGAGHLARPVCRVGALLGFRVSVLDDRPDFVEPARFPDAERVLRVDFTDPFRQVDVGRGTWILLVTRGHRYDYECLRRLLRSPVLPAYIGMIGSRRRVRATYHQLREEGFPPDDLARIRAPVGLDVGAETPEEIAVAVGAELVLLRRGGSGAPLVRVEDIAARFFGEGRSAPAAPGPAPAAETEPEGADGEGTDDRPTSTLPAKEKP